MNQEVQQRDGERQFLPLGSIVILKGSVRKLLVVARGSVVDNAFFDYGAFLYPEGMIDTNVAYFDNSDILKVVHEGFSDQDNDLVLEILGDAFRQFKQRRQGGVSTPQAPATTPAAPLPAGEDLFASVRDLVTEDE